MIQSIEFLLDFNTYYAQLLRCSTTATTTDY